MLETVLRESPDGLRSSLPHDPTMGLIGPLLLTPADLEPPKAPKRASVAFVDVPPEKEPTNSSSLSSIADDQPDKWKSVSSIRSLLSNTSCMLPAKYTYLHVVVFLLTYIGYMQFHAMRKTFSTVKSSLLNTWMPQNATGNTSGDPENAYQLFNSVAEAQDFLGVLDAVFMFCYAAGLFICGILGDRFDPRLVLTIGMCTTAIINFLFGCVTEWTHFYSIPLYVVLWILNGFAQAAGWPMVVCVMGNWFGRGGRGFILGFWSSCQSIGNIVGTYLSMAVLNYGYEYSFLINACLLFAMGIVVFFVLVPAPRDVGLADPDEPEQQGQQGQKDETSSVASERPKPITFFKAVLLPGVIAYSLAYACLKLVNYSVLFWLPYYLDKNFGWSPTDAASVSSFFDWGGVIGGTIGGIVSDMIGKRAPVVSTQLLFSIVAFGVYTLSPNNQAINGLLMGIVGFFVSGASNLISAAVSADLGRQEAVRHSAEALSTVSGIVDGTGSAGAAVGQILVPLFQTWFGWNSIFYMFMVMLLVSLLLLSKLCYRESVEIYRSMRLKINRLATGIGESSTSSTTTLAASSINSSRSNVLAIIDETNKPVDDR